MVPAMSIDLSFPKPPVPTEYLSSKKFEEEVTADVFCALAVF